MDSLTGRQLAAALRKTPGKVAVESIIGTNNVAWLYVEKADLIAWAAAQGDTDLGVILAEEDVGNGHYIKTV